MCYKLLAVLAHIAIQHLETLLDNRAITDVDMSHALVVVLVDRNDGIQ